MNEDLNKSVVSEHFSSVVVNKVNIKFVHERVDGESKIVSKMVLLFIFLVCAVIVDSAAKIHRDVIDLCEGRKCKVTSPVCGIPLTRQSQYPKCLSPNDFCKNPFYEFIPSTETEPKFYTFKEWEITFVIKLSELHNGKVQWEQYVSEEYGFSLSVKKNIGALIFMIGPVRKHCAVIHIGSHSAKPTMLPPTPKHVSTTTKPTTLPPTPKHVSTTQARTSHASTRISTTTTTTEKIVFIVLALLIFFVYKKLRRRNTVTINYNAGNDNLEVFERMIERDVVHNVHVPCKF